MKQTSLWKPLSLVDGIFVVCCPHYYRIILRGRSLVIGPTLKFPHQSLLPYALWMMASFRQTKIHTHMHTRLISEKTFYQRRMILSKRCRLQRLTPPTDNAWGERSHSIINTLTTFARRVSWEKTIDGQQQREGSAYSKYALQKGNPRHWELADDTADLWRSWGHSLDDNHKTKHN